MVALLKPLLPRELTHSWRDTPLDRARFRFPGFAPDTDILTSLKEGTLCCSNPCLVNNRFRLRSSATLPLAKKWQRKLVSVRTCSYASGSVISLKEVCKPNFEGGEYVLSMCCNYSACRSQGVGRRFGALCSTMANVGHYVEDTARKATGYRRGG